jgi:protein NrfC
MQIQPMNDDDEKIVRLFWMSRRDFLQYTGAVVAGSVLGLGCGTDDGATKVAAYAVSEGYLLVDTKKCQGCVACMLACSLVNEGVASLSLARIQVLQNPFAKWPDDVNIEQCRQCPAALCVSACLVQALYVDADNGNVRTVDKKKCTGCGACVKACPYQPKSPLVAVAPQGGGAVTSRKCDLCSQAPYHWAAEGGGPKGRQACVTVCPVRAIAFTAELPIQSEKGYKVNLRNDGYWVTLGYPRF